MALFMKKTLLAAFVMAATAFSSFAQDDLFGSDKMKPRKGFVLGVNGNFDIPGGDMADRFGLSYRIGGAVLYKTTSNWMFGPKVDFILGNKIEDDSLMANMLDNGYTLINQDGQRMKVQVYERGYLAGVQVGKIFNTSKRNSDIGILVMTGVGFIQHKINLYDKDKSIPQLRGDYRKGYDRLTNGMYVEQYVGYNFFDNGGALNFHIGLNIMAGFTQGRRDYQYDLMRADNASRVDLLFGIKGGWYIPIFKRKSEEFYFE